MKIMTISVPRFLALSANTLLMRFLRVLPLLLIIAFVWLLNHSFSPSLPAFGKLLDPVSGALANAEPLDKDFNQSLQLKGLKAPVGIWLDTALIAHIRAGNDHDLYYAQGYLHAYFRLWQMDMQTRAAWGRVSEVAGPKAIDFDRGMRREGMVWGAQHSLDAMEKEPRTKAMLDAYRDGINAYVRSLRSPSLGGGWGGSYRNLPLEYKLMSFAPEEWTNLRTALLMKYMARDLTGKTDDIAYTILRDRLGQQQFDFLFPERIKDSKPVIPAGTKFDAPSLPQPKAPEGEVWAHFRPHPDLPPRGEGGVGRAARKLSAEEEKGSSNLCHSRRESHKLSGIEAYKIPFGNDKVAASSPETESGIGSNNWAVSGAHTVSGKAILCNDPQRGLNLPSLWFEMQLTAPGINCYGASLPGAPGIVIGFNDKISWGFTNNYRDVKDFYEITPAQPLEAPPPAPSNGGGDVGKGTQSLPETSASHTPSFGGGRGEAAQAPWTRPKAYLFNGKALPFQRSVEVIKVRGAADVIDTVLYTIHGPVTFDPTFRVTTSDAPPPGTSLLACTWMAHRGTNELLATYLLNRAGDYNAFTQAIAHFECPAQNIAYADGAGNIAMWAQGRFINKWKDQGKYVMRGDDSSTLWGQDIPMAENPHVLNPPQGYVASANQQVTDSSYPYWYNGSFTEWRSWEINDLLEMYLSHGNKQVQFYSEQPVNIYRGSTPLPQNAFQNNVGSQLARSLMNWYGLRPSYQFDFASFITDSLQSINWLAELDDTSIGATKFQIWWSQLYKDIWQDDFPNTTKYPSSERTVQLLLSDSTSKYYDDKNTPRQETLRDIVQRAFKETTDSLQKLASNSIQQHPTASNKLEWYWVKNTTLLHLAKIPAFSYDHLKIGGWSNTINAATGNHGPSWRMIVEMRSTPKAYTIYPGGQSGNPGSPYYSDFIQQWVEGKYHAARFIPVTTIQNPLKYTWTLSP
jgi:penicillin amidase